MTSRSFSKFVWGVLAYNLLAIAWGVYVRASKSGDGCGTNWPLCDGASIPTSGPFAKFVEGSHRASTALVGVLAIYMLVWAFRAFAKGHLARKASVAVMATTVAEGLFGAMLVKYHLVVYNNSSLRLLVMGLHVISTFALLGSIAVAALAGAGIRPIRLKGQSGIGWILGMAAFGIVMLGFSGALSALGHTLDPVTNVIAAARDPKTFWMVRLQPLHPLIAVSVGLYLLLAAGLIQHLRPDDKVKRAVKWMVGMYIVQIAFGALNIYVRAPIPMQMGHLVLADLNWVSLVVVMVLSLGEGIERVESRPAPEEAPVAAPLGGKPLFKAYIALTKPRVISLLLFTTLTSMIAAKGNWPGTWLFLAVAVGGYMSAGAANAINMVIDRDIDLTMKRTATRPTVTQSIPSLNALMFAFTLALLSFILLWVSANLLSAVLAFSGLVFYVVVYTMMLKRRTWQNIVIGGAAGAFPPLVGWASVTNDLPPLALYLFAIIFVWTPVHFWALALLLKEEYAAAGVPMLPVVKGDRNTVIQIGIYAAITFVVTLVPFLLPQVGWIYTGTAIVLNVILLYYCAQLYRHTSRPMASKLFHFSMVYLAILFLMLAVDRTIVVHGPETAANRGAMSVRLVPFPDGGRQFRQTIVKVALCNYVFAVQGRDLVGNTSLASESR
ncbi:MAG: heme o synthase [Fimbriimonas sp.]|nr:heme o synthase [Fimbriimonas sp.]